MFKFWLSSWCVTLGNLLNLSGLVFSSEELQVIIVLTSQSCIDQITYVYKVTEWCLVQGRTRAMEMFSATIMVEEASRPICYVYNHSVFPQVFVVWSYLCNTVLDTGKKEANKNASKATRLSNVPWCGVWLGRTTKVPRWEWLCLFKEQMTVNCNVHLSTRACAPLKESTGAEKEEKLRGCSRNTNWTVYSNRVRIGRPKESCGKFPVHRITSMTFTHSGWELRRRRIQKCRLSSEQQKCGGISK